MQKIEFTGTHGETLAARLDLPSSGEPKAYALFAHCFTCSKDILAASYIAKTLTQRGIAVLRFDFTGLGASNGDFANTNFTSNIKDLICAANFMREHLQAPALMIGHSLGGLATLVAAAQMPGEVKAVVTIAAPASSAHIVEHFKDRREDILKHGEAEVCLDGRPFRIQKQFIDDAESQNTDAAIRTLKRPLLVMHAPLDPTVGIENAEHIFRLAKHPKSFVSLDDADHLLRNKEHARYAGQVIAAWAGRYIGSEENSQSEDEKTATEPPANVEAGTVTVTWTGESKFRQRIQAGKHTFFADEPESYGGGDTGPDPYSLLLSSLGACTSMTLKMYADHKKLPLEGIEVRLTHEKIHAEECESCETRDGKLDQFSREITIQGDKLTQEQRSRLIEIANKCPVHKTLESEIIIRTSGK